VRPAVNLVLFEPAEIDAPLSRLDPRAVHILKVLRRKEGDPFDAGIVNGSRGKGTISKIGPEELVFRFTAFADPPGLDPIHLVVALPRPQTARKILNEATSLGVASIQFFQSERGEPSYATSSLWTTPEWRRHLIEGAAQAFDTRIPEVVHCPGLDELVAALPAGSARIALDNYEASRRMAPSAVRPLALAFGPERGWSAAERDVLRRNGFELAHLGERVLRTETALVAAIAVAKATPGLKPGA
jgi:16S rRNA (uracil1498-N3)-methyltransferase